MSSSVYYYPVHSDLPPGNTDITLSPPHLDKQGENNVLCTATGEASFHREKGAGKEGGAHQSNQEPSINARTIRHDKPSSHAYTFSPKDSSISLCTIPLRNSVYLERNSTDPFERFI